MFSFTPEVFMQTLPMLAKGMVGIFIVTCVIVLSIMGLNKMGASGKED